MAARYPALHQQQATHRELEGFFFFFCSPPPPLERHAYTDAHKITAQVLETVPLYDALLLLQCAKQNIDTQLLKEEVLIRSSTTAEDNERLKRLNVLAQAITISV